MSRITSLHMTFMDMIILLADGNPGAVTAMAELVNRAAVVDPDSALGALGPIFQLDLLGIYGSDIWVLYKDICGQDAVKMIAVLRATQLGIEDVAWVDAALEAPILASARVDGILAAVREHLPDFAKEAV